MSFFPAISSSAIQKNTMRVVKEGDKQWEKANELVQREKIHLKMQ